MSSPAKPDVLLDRDGVIVRNRDDYVKSWAEVEILPGALAAIARLCRAGHRVIVITNQSAVGRGLMSRETVDDIHRRLADLVRAEAGEIAAFFVCPHHPDTGCACRKPKPGLLIEASRRLGVDLASAYLIGDQQSDIDAAHLAGCRAILVETGDAASVTIDPDHDLRARDLAAAAELVATRSS